MARRRWVRPTPYHFVSTWTVPAPPGTVYRALRDVAGYERWWPQIRASDRVDPTSVRVRCRSFLPINLDFVVTESVVDPDHGFLEGTLHGHLDGWSRWEIGGSGRDTTVRFEERVVTTRLVMNLLTPVARLLFRLNHERMMRDGERGLRTHVAPDPATAVMLPPSAALPEP